MIKTYISNSAEELDNMVNNHSPKPWATQTDTFIFEGNIYYKAVVFYGEK